MQPAHCFNFFQYGLSKVPLCIWLQLPLHRAGIQAIAAGFGSLQHLVDPVAHGRCPINVSWREIGPLRGIWKWWKGLLQLHFR